MEINELPHPDSIWTWKSFARRKKATLWIPYLQEVEPIKGKKDYWRITYNGGAFDFPVASIDCILIYGSSGNIPIEFLDVLSKYGIHLLIHRRNMSNPYIFLPTFSRDENDVLSAHIICRNNNIRRVYIAKTIIRERFRSLEPIFKVSNTAYKKLASYRKLDSVRNWEAIHSKRYWKLYFENLGMSGATRRSKGEVQAALDACSFFIYGVILRWVLLHRLPPSHGFLHEPTNYPSLIYDLIEPYRYILERSVADIVIKNDKVDLTAASLARIKELLEEIIFTNETHQWVRRKNLLHGCVLALRAYLIGDMKRLLIPTEGTSKGGRPPKVSFQLAETNKPNKKEVFD
jgi:CRISPR/Cas system-associated endonuclease Cas1